METNKPAPPSDRLLSIDALRGFDMFWIMGADQLCQVLGRWMDGTIGKHLDEQMDHVAWEGFRFYDLIFALFIFIVGVVLPYSLGKMRERGESLRAIYGRILRRTLLLFIMGLIYYRILDLDWGNIRYVGVLQRIAICYGIAGLIAVHTGIRLQALLTTAILVGYWALLAYVPAPGSQPADYSMYGNLPGYVDQLVLKDYLHGKIFDAYYGYGDNEGILSTLPAVATALLGVMAGQWLRNKNRPPGLKVRDFVLAGVVCLGLGYWWGLWAPENIRFPIIKNIWTSSFALVTGGWSFLLLAFFYGVIDVLNYRRWAFFFVVIGSNAITIYFLAEFVNFKEIGQFFFGGAIRLSGAADHAKEALQITAMLIVKWIFLLLLYKKRLFLRL
jgi:predicted acyltransferase